MPRFDRIRLVVPAFLMLSSATISARADEPSLLAQSSKSDVEIQSESGVRLVRLLELDFDEPDDIPEAPPEPDRLTHLERAGNTHSGVVPLLTVRDPSPPFNLIQASLLTFCAGGATGGIWFAVTRVRRMKTMPARAAITEHFEANEADILARVIAGNVTMIDEAIDAPALTRLFGSATPFARYRIEFTSPAPVNDSPRSDTGNEGIFHRVSEAVTEVEAPHFQHRPATALSGDDRLAAPSGVV